MILSLIISSSVQQHKCSLGFEGASKQDSICRPIRNFLGKFTFDASDMAWSFVDICELKVPPHLAIDRTNWKFGYVDINLLVLALVVSALALTFLVGQREEASFSTPYKKSIQFPAFSTLRRGFDCLRKLLIQAKSEAFSLLSHLLLPLMLCDLHPSSQKIFWQWNINYNTTSEYLSKGRWIINKTLTSTKYNARAIHTKLKKIQIRTLLLYVLRASPLTKGLDIVNN